MNPLLDLSARPVIAHRGASGSAPENTLPAFELAVRQGADAFELDVRLTADGVPVVIHDSTLQRTSGARAGIASQPLSQIREMDAGSRFSPDGGRTFPFRAAGIVVPTLTEVLRSFPDIPLLLDLKVIEAQEAVRRALLEEHAADRCLLASDQETTLSLFSQPPFARAASPREISGLYWGTLLGREPSVAGYRALSVPARYRGLRVPTRGFVKAAREIGCPVHVWTVNDPALARQLWSLGVSGIVTDLPGRLRGMKR